MMRSLIISLCMGMLPQLHAQVRVDAPIEFTGADPEQRQMHGLPTTTGSGALLNAEMELAGIHRHATPAPGTIWEITLPALTNAPEPGTWITVQAPAPAEGSLQISINGSAPYAITHGASAPVQGASVPEGSMLSLVFDGTGFQLLNGARSALKICPAGMVAVNDQYCIELQMRPAGTFWEASMSCASAGARMCSWGEFYSACTQAGQLGITDLTSDWEWTNNTGNENNYARVVGIPSCYGAGVVLATESRKYRCCLSR